jgi:hypothetical protein
LGEIREQVHAGTDCRIKLSKGSVVGVVLLNPVRVRFGNIRTETDTGAGLVHALEQSCGDPSQESCSIGRSLVGLGANNRTIQNVSK